MSIRPWWTPGLMWTARARRRHGPVDTSSHVLDFDRATAARHDNGTTTTVTVTTNTFTASDPGPPLDFVQAGRPIFDVARAVPHLANVHQPILHTAMSRDASASRKCKQASVIVLSPHRHYRRLFRFVLHCSLRATGANATTGHCVTTATATSFVGCLNVV